MLLMQQVDQEKLFNLSYFLPFVPKTSVNHELSLKSQICTCTVNECFRQCLRKIFVSKLYILRKIVTQTLTEAHQ